MVTCDVVVKRFEPPARWYIGSVREFFCKLGRQDTGPKIEEKYRISFDRNLFDALNQLLPVEFWGAVMWEYIDKSIYPEQIPHCFWERLTRDAPTRQDCMTDRWRFHETRILGDIENAGNIRFILWDTRAGGSDHPGVHIPRDDVFSGTSYMDKSLKGDRQLTESWRKWKEEQEQEEKRKQEQEEKRKREQQDKRKREEQQEKRNTSTPIKGGGSKKRPPRERRADLEECLNTLRELHM